MVIGLNLGSITSHCLGNKPALLPRKDTISTLPIFHCHKIKDGGYNNITNTNKVSPAQNTPALQTTEKTLFLSLGKEKSGSKRAVETEPRLRGV